MSPADNNNIDRAAAASTRARRARAEIRRALAARQLCAAQLIRDPPDVIANWRTVELLEAVPGIARRGTKIERLNLRAARADVNLMRPLGRLTDRQREWLIEHALPPERDRWGNEIHHRQSTTNHLTRR